jgi:hypothetical protein
MEGMGTVLQMPRKGDKAERSGRVEGSKGKDRQ